MLTPLQSWLTLAAWGMSMVSIWISVMWMLRNIPRAEWKSNPFAQRPTTVAASESGLLFHQEDRKSDYTWNAFMNFRETAVIFLLYVGESSFVMIPKRAFATAADLDAFSQLLRGAVVPAVPASTAFKPQAVSMAPPPLPVHVQPLESRQFM